MYASDDCLPTPLFRPTKNPFDDFSDSESVSCDEKDFSHNGTLSEIPSRTDKENIISYSKDLPFKVPSLVNAILQKMETNIAFYGNDDDESEFPEEFYDRIDEFLDQEGLNITSPSPFLRCRRAKPAMTVILSTSYITRSETSTTIDGDSPFSDNQTLSAPAFLIRRSISGGINKTSNLLASHFRSEHLLEANSPPSMGLNFFKTFHFEEKTSYNKEETSVIGELQ